MVGPHVVLSVVAAFSRLILWKLPHQHPSQHTGQLAATSTGRTVPGMAHNRYIPKRVVDWQALDNSIEMKVKAAGLRPSTTTGYESSWRRWQEHCRNHDCEPLGAPFAAFEDLLVDMFEDHATWSTVNNALAAITHEHHNAGLVPAHKNPSNVTAWEQLTRGYRRNISTVKTPEPKARPLLREDVLTMLTGPLLNCRANATACAGLVSLDTGATAAELFGLCLSDLVVTEGTIEWNGRVWVCDHTQRVVNIPHPCTYCALRDLIESHPRTSEMFFFEALQPKAQQQFLDGSRRVGMPVFGAPTIYQLPGLSAERRSLRPEDLEEKQLARLRLAIAIRASDPTYYSLIRARAWMILSWPRGLRMGSDLTDLARNDVTVTDTHITLRLRRTKDDGRGQKQVACHYPLVTKTGEPSVAAHAILTYLAVRDLTHSHNDPLIVSTRTRAVIRPKNRDLALTAARDMRQLATAVGLEPLWSAHSTRSGYATQADLDGWAVDEIQSGLRHRSPTTTLAYITRSGRPPQRVAKTLLDAS